MKVGILGATGAVGQKFIRLLRDHPWFEIDALGASERSAGKKYKEAANWIEDVNLPSSIAEMTVANCKPEEFRNVDFVFSGLDSSVAGEIEEAFAKAGIPVISNAKNFRMDETVPLLVPEVNPDHIDLIKTQEFTADGSGWIVTNPNCVAVPLSLALKPLHDNFGIDTVVLTTLQAISGAGYPGVPSLDILGNVVPFISGEEPKIKPETQKLLSDLKDGKLSEPQINLSATATRVPAINGHMISATVKLKKTPSSIDEVKQAIQNWENPIADLDLPSSPKEVIKLHEDDRYPQPRLHADQEGGMQLHMGRLRESEVFDISFVAMAHNTIRGAAGGAILNAELLKVKGLLG
ncbi:MAG TPA: aspartate-semialdehyde dehydrogenase [Balneola sp.]|nr:aspartate-semialdehyde dehydrogenase [Balneola sp.]MBF62976.1 aspartate-semialdehyde dehydrogenase [Balneola sp.]HAH52142.1 aspartate-semialdehyde dehydrogenase [Balneola sp.]HBZ38369.1 aspartate-semialdehyde dehydrogenase [Balneola sp.]|tara:strand:+ start:17226 stop:18275 length:1050 start_codon:yes stop_codon:yes gene_type:complete